MEIPIFMTYRATGSTTASRNDGILVDVLEECLSRNLVEISFASRQPGSLISVFFEVSFPLSFPYDKGNLGLSGNTTLPGSP